MNFMGRAAACAALIVMNAGCAYWTHYTAPIDLGRDSYAMDVKQRVVFGVDRRIYNGTERVICAEPSPDALTTITASSGLGAVNALAAGASRATESGAPGAATGSESRSGQTSSNQSVNVAAALAEQGAFVGLRTQSIQLLRDTMYRLCEGYAAGAIRPEEFTAMQRRYQSTMMGLLAIEQLTRPVMAAQIVLASSASSHAGATGDAIDKARERVDTKAKEEVESRVRLERAKNALAEAERNLAANLKQETDARDKAERETAGDNAAKKSAAEAAVKPFVDARPSLIKARADAKTEVDSEDLKVQDAARARRVAETDLASAQSRAAAAASGQGSIGGMRDGSVQMTADLTKGVAGIVAEINQSYLKDGCFSLIESVSQRSSFQPPPGQSKPSDGQISTVLQTALNTCVAILQKAEERIKSDIMLEQQRR